MKKVIFIILWMVAFWIVAMIFGMISFALLGHAGMESWNDSAVLRIGLIWGVMFFGIPIIGLILGLLGVLPGTRRDKRNTALSERRDR